MADRLRDCKLIRRWIGRIRRPVVGWGPAPIRPVLGWGPGPIRPVLGWGRGPIRGELLPRFSATRSRTMTDQPRTTPTGVKAPHGAKELEISWADGHRSRFPHEILRGYCPCAGCQGHSGMIQFQEGGNLELRELEQVGNYALGLGWGDSHNTGIYSFRYLRALGDLLDAQGLEGVRAMGVLPRI